MRLPNPETWQSRKLTQNRVADYKPFVMVDGEGVRCSLYVSGCPFACEGCFNEAAWNFRYGQPYTSELEDRIIADLGHEAVQGLTLLGGEPFLNTEVCLRLARRVRQVYGAEKDIWCWSGYTFEELREHPVFAHQDKVELLGLLDVLIDGRFELSQRDLSLAFRGSRNQRVLAVSASLASGKAVAWQPRRLMKS